MSILSGYKKVKDRILTSSGYQLLSRWTSSNTVDFDDGKTAQTKVGAINGIIKDKNSLSTVTDDSFAAGAVAVKDAIADVNSKLVNIIRYTTIKGNTDGNGIIYIGQQAPDGAMPILVQIGDSTKWFECTILSKSIDNAQHFAARIRNADGSAYANIKNMVIGVLWGV